MRWISQNAKAIEAGATLVMAIVAVLALIGVKFQIDANEDSARGQSAREIYREFLALSIANPELSAPDSCAPPDGPAYDAYLEYLLYTAEQTTSLDETWDAVVAPWLDRHAFALCESADWQGYSPEVQALIDQTRQRNCATLPECS